MMKYIRYFLSCKHHAYWLRWDRETVPLIEPDDDGMHETHIMKVHCDHCHKDIDLAFLRFVPGLLDKYD